MNIIKDPDQGMDPQSSNPQGTPLNAIMSPNNPLPPSYTSCPPSYSQLSYPTSQPSQPTSQPSHPTSQQSNLTAQTSYPSQPLDQPSQAYDPMKLSYPNSEFSNLPSEINVLEKYVQIGESVEAPKLSNLDDEEDDFRAMDFSDKSIRKGFIRKVYGIMFCQILATAGIIFIFMYVSPIRQWARKRKTEKGSETQLYLLYGSMAVSIICICIMACFESIRRKAPMNYIFLCIFTLSMSLPLGYIAALTDSNAVLMAMGMTAALCLALTLFAFQTKWDFTSLGAILLCFLVCLSLFGVSAIFLPMSKLAESLYCTIGVLLFSFYLIYDTQLMLGGKHKYSISPEEYVFAALSLYLDVINIFIRILRLMR